MACALVTIVETAGSTPRKTGSTMAVRIDGTTEGSVGGGAVELACIALAQEAIARKRCCTRRFVSKGEGDDWRLSDYDAVLGVCGGSLSVFIQPLVPDPELVIFGGGHVAKDLGRLCDLLEMPYRVYDDRQDFVASERYPGARERLCAPFTEIASHISLSCTSYCVIVTYGHEHDEVVLDQLLRNSELPYIGMIGSPNKASVLIRNIKRRDGVIDDRLYCPIGLRIGRNLPQEIALAVMAEVMLLMHGGRPEHRRIDWTVDSPDA
jgi:xanthine dehydrogenase accessory factor